LLLISVLQKFGSKWFLTDSYLLTSTRTAPPRLLHPPPTTCGSFGAPEGLPDTSWPWGLSPCPQPPLLLLPEERLTAGGPRSTNTRTQREMVLYFHGGSFVSPSRSQPSRSGDGSGWILGGAGAQRHAAFHFSWKRAGLGSPPSPQLSQRDRSLHVRLPEQQLWLPGAGGASHEASLSHRAFLVLEEAEEAELQTPASGTACPLPSSISVRGSAVASWDRWQGQGHEVPMPSGAAQCCAQPFQGPGGARSPIQVLPAKAVHRRSPRGSGKLRSPKPPASPQGCQLGGIAFRTVAGQEKPASTGLF